MGKKENEQLDTVEMETIVIEGEPTIAREDEIECKHWRRTLGKCMFGSNCKFKHISFQVTRPRVAPVPRNSKGKRLRKHPRNRGRAGEFRRWLIEEFGLDLLKSGSGLLDVAGGRGAISFELTNLNGCSSTIVDPRQFIDYSVFQRKLLKGFYHRNECFLVSEQVPTSVNEIQTPRHLKLFWRPSLWESLSMGLDENGLPLCQTKDYDREYKQFRASFESPTTEQSRTELAKQFQIARDFVWSFQGLHKDAEESNASHEDDWSLEEVLDLLTNCSCIVGMHPDQATEGIVDFALHHQKPFAVVPCCVYSKQYPWKQTPDHRLVSNHADLVDHLAAKHPAIRKHHLPFEGQNTVLYWNPEWTDSAE